MSTAKTVSVEINALDSKGNIVESFTHDISRINAGKEIYGSMVLTESDWDIASYEVVSMNVENPLSVYVDCLNDIKVSPEKGKATEKNQFTLEYVGDITKLGGNTIYVDGSIVYYDSDNNIVGSCYIAEMMNVSNENRKLTFEDNIGLEGDKVDHYEVILCGACYME